MHLTERTLKMQDKTESTGGRSSAAKPQNAPESMQGASMASGSGSAGRNASSSASGTDPSNMATMEKARQTISTVANQAGDKVVSGLDMQKTKAAEGLRSVAQALRQTSDQLRDDNQDAAAPQYISSAANQVERLSGYLQSTNTREIVRGVEQFARHQPALFVGSAFMLGLVAARFLKSSAASDESTDMSGGRRWDRDDRFTETSAYGRGYSDERGTQGSGLGTQSSGLGTQGSGGGTQGSGLGTQGSGVGPQGSDYSTPKSTTRSRGTH